jgi:PAS domain S-box-containing protein
MRASQHSPASNSSIQPQRWLRRGIIAFCLAVMAGYGVDTYRHVVEERDDIIRDATERAEALVISLDEHLTRTVQAVDLVLASAADKVDAQLRNEKPDYAALGHALYELHWRAPQVRNLLFVDAEGRIAAASAITDAVGLDVSRREFFRAHVNSLSSETASHAPFLGRVGGRLFVPLSQRIENLNGRFAGVLIVSLETDYLEDFYTRILGRLPVTLTVYSQEGMQLARIPRRVGSMGADMSGDPLFAASFEAPSAVKRFTADEYGPDRYAAYRKASALPYVIAASMSEDVLLAGWREQAGDTLRQTALISIAVLALAVFLVAMTYRRDRLAREFAAQAALLQDAIEALPDGFVLYDADDRLVMCNSKFRELRAANPISYQVGARFEDILRQALSVGESELPAGYEAEAWIRKRLDDRRNSFGRSRMSRTGGRWLRVSEQRTRDGGMAAIHADITALKMAQAEVEASRARMTDWAEASNDWFWETDPDQRLRYMSDRHNPAGSTSTTSLGKRISDLASDTVSEAEKWARHLEVLERREPFRDFVFKITDRNGLSRVLSASAKPIFADDGGFAGYRGTARDVTAEVTAKEIAARAQKRLSEALEATEEGFAIWDAEDRLVLCNSPFRRLHGVLADLYQPGARFDDIVRQAVARGHVPHAAGREKALIAERLASHRRDKGVFESLLADGRWKRVKEYRMDDGGVVGVHIDITDQKTRELELAELARRNALFFAAMSRATSAMIIADAKAAGEPIIYVNPAFTILTGYSEAEAIGQGIEFIYDAAEDPAAGEAIRKAIAARQPIEARVPARHRDGRRLYLDLRAGPVADRDGEVTHFIVVQDDVTRRVEAEAQRSELENQLRHSQKIEALGTLAGGIAHDVNNTLVPIVALSRMALKSLPPDSGQRDSMQIILDAAFRIRDLVTGILAFSRKDLPRAEPVELQGAVAKAVRLLTATLTPNVIISQDLAAEPVTVNADENQLIQVLMNLCTNAAHAIGTIPGRVTVALDTVTLSESASTGMGAMPPGSYARMAVSDTGCGMDARTQQRIFEPFYTTKGVGEGTGLGLSVVHGIVANHRGRISVDSEVGRGTTFTILLPLAVDRLCETTDAPQLAVA